MKMLRKTVLLGLFSVVAIAPVATSLIGPALASSSSPILLSSTTAPQAVGGNIFRRSGNSWGEPIEGRALDIAAGGNNSVWKIGPEQLDNGYAIYQLVNQKWQQVGGWGVQVAVGNTGRPWLLNAGGQIFERVDNSWQNRSGDQRARDIAVGGANDSDVWIIGMDAVANNGRDYGIFRRNGSGWTQVGGHGVRIAVDGSGTPWMVNSSGQIFERVNNTWQNRTGNYRARDIGAGGNGSIWIIGTEAVANNGQDFPIYRWNSTNGDWVGVGGHGVRVDVDASGNPWLLNSGSSPSASQPSFPSILPEAEFLNNWRNWPEYTTYNPFPDQGQNCTWYAHGRMLQLGYSKYALDSMLGNAGTWDDTSARGVQVTNTPTVGAIALWEANFNGAGSVGHVAVVERVNSDNTITISESNWSGKAYNIRNIPANIPSKFIVVPR